MKKSILLSVILASTWPFVNAQNTNWGTNSGTSGTNNSFFGYYSGNAANSSSADNSFFGFNSGKLTTSGIRNTGMGSSSLIGNTTGNYNNAFGFLSLNSNTTGSASDAFGYSALYANTSGSYNTALGHKALYQNTTGSYNVAVGLEGIFSNTSGGNNTGVGYLALHVNTTASDNTAIGFYSMVSNTTGAQNTAIGSQSLRTNTTGNYNTAIGYEALYNVGTGSSNVGVGYNAGPTGDYTNTISIGYNAAASASNHVVIGNSSMTSIGGQVGWSTLSDGRFKTNVKEDVPGIEFIKQLRPISYTVDTDAFDSFTGVNIKRKQPDSIKQIAHELQSIPQANSLRQTGFIAQEVEGVMKKSGVTFSGLVAPENEKDYYTLRYGDFVVPLVKAVQEFNSEMISQQKKIDSLMSKVNGITNPKETISGRSSLPVTFGSQAILNQNSPNPFSTSTQITMTLPDAGKVVTIFIYNMQGMQLKSIPVTSRGNVSVNIAAGELTAGMYLYALVVDGQLIDTKRMILTY